MNKKISFLRGWKCWLINNLTFQASKCINSSYNVKHSKILVSSSSLWRLSRIYELFVFCTYNVSLYTWVVHQDDSLIFSFLSIFLLRNIYFLHGHALYYSSFMKYIYTLKSKYCLFYLLMVLWRMLCPFHPQQVTKKILQGSSFCLTVWWSLGDLADYKKIYIEVTNMSKLFRCIKS